LGDHHFESLKGSLYNVNRLANFDRRIDGDDLLGASLRLKCGDDLFLQGCQAISKTEDSADSVRAFNRPTLSGIDKFRKQISREHRLHKPHWPSLGQLAKTQSRRETMDSKLTPQCERRQVLSFGFSPQAEPHRIVSQRQQGRGLRHRAN